MSEANLSAEDQLCELYTYGHAQNNAVKHQGNLDVMNTDGNVVKDNHDALDCILNNNSVGSENGEPVAKSPDDNLKITWMDGSRTTNHPSDVIIVDRSFLLGDFVALASDAGKQVGKVTNISIAVDLLAPTGEVIENVSSKYLKRVREFAFGDYVVSGNWVGRVEDVSDDVTLLFDDGSVIKVLEADACFITPVCRRINEDSSFPYYPGLRVKVVATSSIFDSLLLSRPRKVNHLEGTVTKVEVGSVCVHWITSANPGLVTDFPNRPPMRQKPKDLTLLSYFTHTKWQLGDCCLVAELESAKPCFLGNTSARFCRKFAQHQEPQGQHVTENTIKEETAGSSEYCLIGCHGSSVKVDNEFTKTCKTLNNDELKSINLPQELVLHRYTDYCCPESSPVQKDDRSYQNCNANLCLNTEMTPELDVSKNSTLVTYCSEHGIIRRWNQNMLCVPMEKIHNKVENMEHAYLITNTMTKVDVVWQDGTRQFNLDSVSLIPIEDIGDYELFPDQYVVQYVEEDSTSDSKRVGVVRNMDAKERTVHVKWLKPPSQPGEYQDAIEEEVVSAYEIYAHSEYDYRYGDVVGRMPPFTTSIDSTISAKIEEKKSNIHQGNPDFGIEHASASNEKDAFNNLPAGNAQGLSCFGLITSFKGGDIEIAWGDLTVSKVGPEGLYFVARGLTDAQAFIGESEHSDGAVWDTTEGNDIATDDNVGEDCSRQFPYEAKTGKVKNLSNLFGAVGYIARLASDFFSLGIKDVSSSSYRKADNSEEEKVGSDDEIHERVAQSFKGNMIGDVCSDEHDVAKGSDQQITGVAASDQTRATSSSTNAESRMEANLNDNEVPNKMGLQIKNSFDTSGIHGPRQFDVVKAPSDHHFLAHGKKVAGGRKWTKRIQQEWIILQRNLPDEIFVKVFEDHMDLLRAVIIGAYGTPYQDGLYFFDFCLPPEFPQVPPAAYYHSRGLRMNPNLYEDGLVCLSLLNTWTGSGNEVWDPSSSSILQVLVSLQGLVLNSKPYFNEPGYELQMGSTEGEHHSLSYNEHTFLLNLKSMTYILQRPPMLFEDFVLNHFRRRGSCILRACDAFLNGCLVGSLTGDARKTDKSCEQLCSAGFKLVLAKIIPKLYSALRDVGADCSEFEHLRSSDKC